MRSLFLSTVLLMTAVSSGCSSKSDSSTQPQAEKKGIFGKTTQEIGQFDATAPGGQVSDQKIRATDPITAPLSAYGPLAEKASILAVDQAIGIFYATEGRYPANHAEFMEKIITANGMKLPVLPNKGQYKYDEASHSLVVVYPDAQPQGQ